MELDFREAVFGPGQIDLHAVAVMGGIQIIVPPNLRVETSGFAILGGLEDRSEYRSSQHANEPMLKIRGFAVMGGSRSTCVSPVRPLVRPKGGGERHDARSEAVTRTKCLTET